MLKYIRIALVTLFLLALAGSAGLFYYNYTHEDNQPPAFSKEQELVEVSVTDPPEALLQGLAAYDNVDGDVTDRIKVKKISQLVNETDVIVTYIVFDNSSNYATCERTARYKDYTSPRFELLKPMLFNTGDTVTFLDRIVAMDQRDGNITGRMKLEESTVVSSIPGTYHATVSVTNAMGDTVYLPLTVQVVNKSVSMPTVELKENLVYLSQGSTLRSRAFLEDVRDPLEKEEISKSQVTINAKGLDTSTPGVYEVYYYYTGLSGETATAILTVVVE